MESESIISGLKVKLRKIVRDPWCNSEEQMLNAAMLIDLNEPPEQLLADIINTRRERMKKELNKSVEEQANNIRKVSNRLVRLPLA